MNSEYLKHGTSEHEFLHGCNFKINRIRLKTKNPDILDLLDDLSEHIGDYFVEKADD